MKKKIKVLVISDHPLSPSGVGTQTKYIMESLLKTGKFSIVCLGGAIKHPNYDPQKISPYEDDWIIYPIDGYGSDDKIRSVIRTERPDILWFMTDPRFYEWLWFIENEVRPIIPMVYYHVWDNYPAPMYNRPFYLSNDVIASISKVTHDIVNEVAPEVDNVYLPHAVQSVVFKPYPEEQIKALREVHFPKMGMDKVIFFWNNRNARRKQSGTLLWWFNEFAEEVGVENVKLVMHTDPSDPHGQPLDHMIQAIGASDGRIMLSTEKLPPENLADMYNMADCTINIADAEGFGLATLESLSCGTPIIATMTGGLQEQVTDGEDWFGVGIEPASRVVIGSQQVPYIHEDRISKEDFMKALHKMYNMSRQERKEVGLLGAQHVDKNYNFEEYGKKWVDLMLGVHEKYGSWENRKGYERWTFMEVV
jgi:glycosyltransferase involved in cell wall biosynthesis